MERNSALAELPDVLLAWICQVSGDRSQRRLDTFAARRAEWLPFASTPDVPPGMLEEAPHLLIDAVLASACRELDQADMKTAMKTRLAIYKVTLATLEANPRWFNAKKLSAPQAAALRHLSDLLGLEPLLRAARAGQLPTQSGRT